MIVAKGGGKVTLAKMTAPRDLFELERTQSRAGAYIILVWSLLRFSIELKLTSRVNRGLDELRVHRYVIFTEQVPHDM